MNISFIGFGHMAKAIATKLAMDKNYQLRAASPSLSVGTNRLGVETHHDNLKILPDADVVILAVKPAQMAAVMQQIHAAIPTHAVVISIAAGISLSWFEQRYRRLPIVRSMPNIGSASGKGATPLIANHLVSSAQKKWVEDIFNAIGITTWAKNEDEMDAFTALSGSGPAYVFLFIEAMIDGACALGLDKQTATAFALQTIDGALNLARKNTESIAELRKQVTSPAGTTAAAINVFQHQGLNGLVDSAMKAAFKRAKELGSVN